MQIINTMTNRSNRNYGKCNAFWSFVLPWKFARIMVAISVTKTMVTIARPTGMDCA